MRREAARTMLVPMQVLNYGLAPLHFETEDAGCGNRSAK